MEQITERMNAIHKLNELIEDIEFAMLTTARANGTLHSRPMATQQRECDGTLWFFTRLASQTSNEVNSRHEVNLSYSDPDKQRYVSVSGRAELVRDLAKMEEAWNPLYKAWFPKGLDDPQIALLRVDVSEAEYWDVSEGRMVELLGFAKAMATGETYKSGEHKKVKKDPAA